LIDKATIASAPQSSAFFGAFVAYLSDMGVSLGAQDADRQDDQPSS
jgi:hypothetical protein